MSPFDAFDFKLVWRKSDQTSHSFAGGPNFGTFARVALASAEKAPVTRRFAVGSAAKLIRKPDSLGTINSPPSENPSAIAESIAPEITCPEFCATILVTATCKARSFKLSGAR
mgnify:CR=1 FL=1